jgi:general secretion pathway protein D
MTKQELYKACARYKGDFNFMKTVEQSSKPERVGRGSLFVALLLSAALLMGCAQQRIRDSAEAAMRAGEYEQALLGLQSGLANYPDSAVLRASLAEVRGDVLARLTAQAASERGQGKFDLAEKSLRRALALEPTNARVTALLEDLTIDRRQNAAMTEIDALVAQHKLSDALRLLAETLKSNPSQPQLLNLQRRLEQEQRKLQLASARLGLTETRPISLDFRDANLRTVLDVVSRNSGINFILDKDIRPDVRVTVYMRQAKVEDAIDLITSTYQLAKKVVDRKTLLIYPNTAEKQREHQEQVVKVFYLTNGDAKGAAAFLKSMLKIRDPYVDEHSNMLAVRDSAETIQMAERLVAVYDTSEPEVLLDVEVIEVNTARLTQLGVQLPNTFSLTLLPPASATSLNLSNIQGITRDRIGFAVGGVTVNLLRQTGDFKTLANPSIRVRNKEKAKIMVGDKVPVVSATTGQNGFVSDSVNYLDVGLKLDVEPSIYINDEVAIKIALEVSSLGTSITTSSGTTAYQIGTRNASTLLRLRDGETQLLAGLISTQERSDANRLPGLGDLPTVGRLFSSTRDDNRRTELVLSITPHILRNVRRPDSNESELWVGTEGMPRLRPAGGVFPTIDEGSLATSTPTLPGPTSAEASASPPALAGLSGASSAEPAASNSAATSISPTLQWSGPSQAKVGDSFVVTLNLKTDQPLRGAPLQLGFNAERFEILAIDEEDFFKQGAVQTSFAQSVDKAAGRASVGVLRNQANGAVGQGKVATLRLKALSAGQAELTIQDFNPIGLSGPVPKPTSLPSYHVQVQ